MQTLFGHIELVNDRKGEFVNFEVKPLTAGLYFIATPIGTARDITLRALDLLASADYIAAEDTRTARKLMEIHGVPLGNRKLIAFHDHSSSVTRDYILELIEGGASVVYASEAGTPLVADPGFTLARGAIAADLPLWAAPGPSAVLAALNVSGLPTDRFFFAGFPPSAKSARTTFLQELAQVDATLVFYESPKRVYGLLEEMCKTLGEEREAAVCRELTKRFEQIERGNLAYLTEAFSDRTVKGEIVVVVDRSHKAQFGADDMDAALATALETMSVKDAAAAVSTALNLPRRDVYQAALKLGK